MPSRWTGTTGTPVRTARKAAPARKAWPHPSGLRPPSGKITMLQPSSMSSAARAADRRPTLVRSIGMALRARADRVALTRVSKK